MLFFVGFFGPFMLVGRKQFILAHRLERVKRIKSKHISPFPEGIKEIKHKNICERLLLHSGKKPPLISTIYKVPVSQGSVLGMCCPEETACHNYSYCSYCQVVTQHCLASNLNAKI